MVKFFYYSRNIIGLILLISPLVGFLFIDLNFTLSMVLLCALGAGILLGAACYDFLNFRLWTSLFCIAAAAGAFLLHGAESAYTGQTTVLSVAGTAFLGLYGGSLCSIIPSNILVNWFRASKSILTGVVFSVSAVLGAFYSFFMERHTYFALTLGLILMLAGVLFFLQHPPFFMCSPVTSAGERFESGKRRLTLKVFAFMFSASFVSGLSVFNPPDDIAAGFFISPQLLLIAGLAAGSLAAGILSEFKGIYSCCILIIFLAEFFIFCPDMTSLLWQPFVHAFLWGLFLSAAAVVIPIAVYYIYGPQGYNGCLGKVWSSLPLGIAFSGFVSKGMKSLGAADLLSPQTGYILLTVLLVTCFFTIFSAWKHRFILL